MVKRLALEISTEFEKEQSASVGRPVWNQQTNKISSLQKRKRKKVCSPPEHKSNWNGERKRERESIQPVKIEEQTAET